MRALLRLIHNEVLFLFLAGLLLVMLGEALRLGVAQWLMLCGWL